MSTNKSLDTNSKKHLVKSTSIISFGVLTSRCLGFIRDVVLAGLLGTGPIAEAFFVALRIPNTLRDLVGEGAANAAIVPVLCEYQKTKSKEQWLKLINVMLAWGTIVLTVLTIAGMILTPWIVRFIAPGFLGSAYQYNLTVDLTRIMFPYLILIALTALQMGVLYTLNSFTAPAFSSCLLNIALIFSAWLAALFSWAAAYILAIGVVVGGILQLLWQGRALARLGIIWKWPSRLRNEGMSKIAKLLVPRMWGSAVYQMNIFVDTLCASLSFIVGPGGIAAIYFANRLVQLPIGVFAYAFSSASLPTLSNLWTSGDEAAFKETLFFSLKSLLFLLLPCAVMLFILSPFLIQTVFQRGAFDAYSSSITASALQFLSLGLPFFGATRILISGFYAVQDTQTPVKIATVCLLINVVLNIVLMFPLKIGGIALASSVSGLANFTILYLALNERLKSSRGILKKFLLRISPCLVMMASVMFFLLTVLSLNAWIKLLIVPAAGALTYLLCCQFMQVAEVRPLWKTLRRKFRTFR